MSCLLGRQHEELAPQTAGHAAILMSTSWTPSSVLSHGTRRHSLPLAHVLLPNWAACRWSSFRTGRDTARLRVTPSLKAPQLVIAPMVDQAPEPPRTTIPGVHGRGHGCSVPLRRRSAPQRNISYITLSTASCVCVSTCRQFALEDRSSTSPEEDRQHVNASRACMFKRVNFQWYSATLPRH